MQKQIEVRRGYRMTVDSQGHVAIPVDGGDPKSSYSTGYQAFNVLPSSQIVAYDALCVVVEPKFEESTRDLLESRGFRCGAPRECYVANGPDGYVVHDIIDIDE